MAIVDARPTEASVVHEEVLGNGLRVLIQEVHTAPLASVWCWYRVGSKDEAPGLTGVSHWVEHMNFKGTTNIPREKIKGIIEQHGGYWNGYTWIDQTTYTETATRDALDHMLFIEAERMANCLYDPADCESERTVIISELQGGENDPDQLLDQELTATAFRAHPYRNPTIGWLGDLETMTREDLYGHYRRFYVPNNATLVVVGDVATRDTLRSIAKHFDGIAPGDASRRSPTREPEQIGERRLTIAKEGTTAYLKLGFHAPAATDPDFFPLLVLDTVLSGAKGINLWASFRTPPPQRSARLYHAPDVGGQRRLRADRRALSLHHLADRDRGHTACRARGGDAARTRAGPRAGRYRAGAPEGQDAAARASGVRTGQHLQHCAPARLLSNNRQLAVFPRHRLPDRCRDAGSGCGGCRRPPEAVKLHHWTVRAAASGNGRPEPGGRGRRLGPRFAVSSMTTSQHGPAEAGRPVRGLSPSKQVLPNGVTVIAKETRTTPAVTIYAGLHAGAIYDPPGGGGLAHFVSRMLERGTPTRTGDQIEEELDSRGVSPL